jgi:hypothetical protein
MSLFVGAMLLMWEGPKTGRGYLLAVVLFSVAAGLTLLSMML